MSRIGTLAVMATLAWPLAAQEQYSFCSTREAIVEQTSTILDTSCTPQDEISLSMKCYLSMIEIIIILDSCWEIWGTYLQQLQDYVHSQSELVNN